MMNAEIVAVGSELLTPDKVDTNSLFLTEQLNAMGVEVVMKSIVGDDRARLTAAVAGALSRSGVVILTGGLGPTEDDVTRDAVAAALGRNQVFMPEIAAGIEDRFRRMGRRMAEINKRQAFLIEGAEELPNGNGTAPGQFLLQEGRVVMLLPGPPRELMPMFREQCAPRLQRLVSPQVIRTLVLRTAGMGESDLDALIAPVYTRYTNPVTTILAAAGDVQVHLRAHADTVGEAEWLLNEVSRQIEPLLGEHLYTRTGATLEATLGEMLLQRKATLAVAESCTGGLLSQRMTANPGASQYFVGGFVTYTEAMKTNLLGVDLDVLQNHGVVSEAVAEAMALGTQERTGATYALSVTGYAGPDGGTPENPVGTVYLGLATRKACQVFRYRFTGDRDRVRTLAVQTALDVLRRKMAQ